MFHYYYIGTYCYNCLDTREMVKPVFLSFLNDLLAHDFLKKSIFRFRKLCRKNIRLRLQLWTKYIQMK